MNDPTCFLVVSGGSFGMALIFSFVGLTASFQQYDLEFHFKFSKP